MMRRPGFLLMVVASLLARVAGATPTADQLNTIAADLQTPTRYGVVLPAPAVYRGRDLIAVGNYINPQVFQFGPSWYLLADYVTVGSATTTVLFGGPGPLGPWQKLSAALPTGPTWDSCLASGTMGLVGTLWGNNTPQSLGSQYAMSYYGNAACVLNGTAVGIATAQQPNQFTPWGRASSPSLSPTDSGARLFESAAMYRSTIFQPATPASGFTYLMFATVSGDSTTLQIAAYGSNDGINWQRYGTAPVVGPGGNYPFRQAANPQVILHPSGLYVLAFSLTEAAGTNVDTFAATDDPALLSWTKYQVVNPNYALLTSSPVTIGSAGIPNYMYDANAAYRPWIFKDRGVVYHYYNATPLTGQGTAPAVAVGSLAANGSFEDADATSTPSNWQTYCGAAGTDCDASYTDSAQSHSGQAELTHCKEADYDVATYQTLNNLTNGTYGVSAWVQSSGGQYSVSMSVTGHGGTSYSVPISNSSAWTQIVIPALSVTTGTMTINFASHGQAGDFIHVDDLVITPLGRNFAFDQVSYPSQDVASWTTTCTGLGGNCDADFVEQGGRTGLRLSHGNASPYQVQTSQTMTVPNGTYYASVWVLSPTGCGQVGGSTNDASSTFQVSNYGGAMLEQQVSTTARWAQTIVPNIQVTLGTVTLSFVSDCDANTVVSFDDVQFYRLGQQ